MNTLKKFKLTYDDRGTVKEVVIEATSKYDAKTKFHFKYPRAELLRTEVEE